MQRMIDLTISETETILEALRGEKLEYMGKAKEYSAMTGEKAALCAEAAQKRIDNAEALIKKLNTSRRI